MAAVPFTMHTRPGEVAYISIGIRFAIGQLIDSEPRQAKQLIGFILTERHIVL
jgi:hypothetical protein